MANLFVDAENLFSINGGGIAYDSGKVCGVLCYNWGKKSIEIGMNIRENIIEPLEKRAMLFFAIINELPRIQIELLKNY